MIERYTNPEMGAIWAEPNKYRTWLDVEIAVCEAWAKLGKIPAGVPQDDQGQGGFRRQSGSTRSRRSSSTTSSPS